MVNSIWEIYMHDMVSYIVRIIYVVNSIWEIYMHDMVSFIVRIIYLVNSIWEISMMYVSGVICTTN